MMKTLLAVAGGMVFLSAAMVAKAGTLFTNPVLYVAPMALDFGPVARQTVATNTFVVENMGVGILTGTASVAAPFKIISGGAYALSANEAQVVTVVYTPSGAPSDTQTVKLTGGGGAKATVTGKPGPDPVKKPKRKS
jgi:hypothetical protein